VIATKKVLQILIVVMVVFIATSCQREKVPGHEVPSTAQIGVPGGAGHTTSDTVRVVSLSRSLHRIVSDNPNLTEDTASGSDASLDKMIDSAALLLSSRLFMVTDPERIVGELNSLVFEKWGVTFSANRTSAEYLFPHRVLQVKKGSCVGMSLLYLLIAEKAGIPLYGVLAPGHFYVRFDNGAVKRNIETLRKGENMPTEWYRTKYGITDTLLYTMKNLTAAEVIAVVEYNVGTILLTEKKYGASREYLQRSVEAFPSFAEAQGNYALVLDALGQSLRALKTLLHLQATYPSLTHIDRNIASLQLKCSKFDDALVTYEKLCGQEPQNPEYLYGRGMALYKLGRNEEAVSVLSVVVSGTPEIVQEVTALLEMIISQPAPAAP